jgi:DNA-binding NarL/FixJ family response regulator
MRVVLVGSPAERDALRARLDGTIDIAAEFATLAAARAADVDADAILLPPPDRVPSSPFARARLGDETIDEPLTPREIQVIELLAEGLSNKAIAARLGISEATVKAHLTRVYRQIGVYDRTQAALWARRHVAD